MQKYCLDVNIFIFVRREELPLIFYCENLPFFLEASKSTFLFLVYKFVVITTERLNLRLSVTSLLFFLKREIKKWKPVNCPCRLCRPYIQNVGFL